VILEAGEVRDHFFIFLTSGTSSSDESSGGMLAFGFTAGFAGFAAGFFFATNSSSLESSLATFDGAFFATFFGLLTKSSSLAFAWRHRADSPR
jgi:hypothetical protein